MLKKEFLKHVIPSLIAFTLSGLYQIVDGVFVGNGFGDSGIAAINIAYPIVAFFQACGTGIGMAGSILYSINQDPQKKKKIFGNTILFMIISNLVLLMTFAFLGNYLIEIQGGSELVQNFASEYLMVLVYGSILQIMATGLVPFIRNFNGSLFAMLSMISGCIVNIVLDYVFINVLKSGIDGASYATLIGQFVSLAICLGFIIVKKIRFNFSFKKKDLHIYKEVFINSLSPFGLTYSPNLIVFIVNIFAYKYGGDEAVSAYGVIAYITLIVIMLLQGVGDGSQPLISKYFGKDMYVETNKIKKYSFITTIVLSVIFSILTFLTKDLFGPLFGSSIEVSRIVSSKMIYFIVGFTFVGFARNSVSYFYALKEVFISNLITYSEVLTLLSLLILMTDIYSIEGVWISILTSQILVFVISLVCLYEHKTEKRIVNYLQI